MSSRDKANYQQAKKLVEDLKRESQLRRMKVSQAANDIV
uniref:G protein gamma domain-containing protein n=1 Tax=Romanomermis culicivorax TaxID=13658 RepID=A0A915I8J9_ROMCU